MISHQESRIYLLQRDEVCYILQHRLIVSDSSGELTHTDLPMYQLDTVISDLKDDGMISTAFD